MAELTLEQALELAIQQHQQGNLQQAEQIYRQILAVAPDHPQTLEQFGILALQAGRPDVAVELIGKAAMGNPNSPDCQYNHGLALATAGKPQEAIAAYQRALRLKPDLVEAYNNLAALMVNTGQLDTAVEYCRKAISLRPELAEAHENLGAALRAKGLYEQSIQAHRQGTVLRPQNPESWNGLGISLQMAGRIDEAMEAFQRATTLNPNHADALENLGAILHQKKRTADGLTLLRRALAIRPNTPETLSNVAALLIELRQFDEAIDLLARAVTLKPHFADAHNNLGLALRHQGRLPEAERAHRAALGYRPNSPEILRNLGQALQLMGRTSEAVEEYRKALAIQPDYFQAISTLGTALMELREIDAGTKAFRQAIAIKPDYALAHFNLSQALLLSGDWLEAWDEQEWRWRTPDLGLPRPAFEQPEWDGSDLNGRRILVYAEQGFGDALHFGRYLPLLAQRGGRVIFHCHAGLERLFERLPGIEVVPFEASPPEFDCQIALMSLPRVFRTTPESIPLREGYLHADPELVERWKSRVNERAGNARKIGLVWAGRGDQKNDRNRSMPLSALSPLAEVSNITFFSLQKGEPARQLEHSPAGLSIVDWSSDLKDFADTAALLANLDLLISADTAPAHLAGAMGLPVWVLAAFFADWRYMLNREDNPWYASMRVFRQPTAGDWQTPVRQVIARLIEGEIPRVQ